MTKKSSEAEWYHPNPQMMIAYIRRIPYGGTISNQYLPGIDIPQGTYLIRISNGFEWAVTPHQLARVKHKQHLRIGTSRIVTLVMVRMAVKKHARVFVIHRNGTRNEVGSCEPGDSLFVHPETGAMYQTKGSDQERVIVLHSNCLEPNPFCIISETLYSQTISHRPGR